MASRSDGPDSGFASPRTEAMRAWRAAHPTATFAEIEREATRQVASLRTELIATALACDVLDEAPTCAACDRRMARAGSRTRTVITDQQQRVTVTGQRFRCSACGAELSPPSLRPWTWEPAAIPPGLSKAPSAWEARMPLARRRPCCTTSLASR